jgi:hypothetical protein
VSYELPWLDLQQGAAFGIESDIEGRATVPVSESHVMAGPGFVVGGTMPELGVRVGAGFKRDDPSREACLPQTRCVLPLVCPYIDDQVDLAPAQQAHTSGRW